MADIADTLKNILGDDAEDKIKNVMGSLASDADGGEIQNIDNDLGDIMALRSMIEGLAMNRNEPRTNLLMSLKPYMRDSRKQSIDNAVKMLGMVNIIRMLSK